MADIPANPAEYLYRPNAQIVISGREFMLLQALAEKAMKNGIREEFVQAHEWVNLETSKIVKKPTKKQIEAGKVRQIPSKDATMNNKNVIYDANLHPEVFNGNELLFSIHLRNIEGDVAVHRSILEKERQEAIAAAQNKGNMQVVEDSAPQQEEAPQETEG